MSYLAFVVVLGVLIFVHELGHFWAAKAVGIGVPRFSIGLGPLTPLRFRRGETEYVISWIPFGGYVKMASQEELNELEALEGGVAEHTYPPEKLFENKRLAARILVISAGVVMNAVFAWATYAWLAFAYGVATDPTTRIARVDADLLPEAAHELASIPSGAEVVRIDGEAVAHWNAIVEAILESEAPEVRIELAGGLEPIVVDVPPADAEARRRIARALVPLRASRVGSLSPGSPAERAGLEPGDLIVAIDGDEVRSWADMVRVVEAAAGRELVLSVDRDGTTLEIPVTPAESPAPDPETGETRMVGKLGIGPAWVRIRYGVSEALAEGVRQSAWAAGQVIFAVKGMIVGQISVREIGGPIAIAQMSAEAAREGLEFLLSLMAFLSINLAILNLLPIPALDGGHLVFLTLEGLRGGRPVPSAWRGRLTMAGIYFLLVLMVFVVINDLLR